MDDGKVYFWQFTKGRRPWPGWHIAFDGCGHARLLDVLRRLPAGDPAGPSGTPLRVLRPSPAVLAVVSNKGGRFESPRRLRMVLDAPADRWGFVADGPEVVLHMGSRRHARVIDWLSDPDTAFDTAVGDPPLWCWGVVTAGRQPTDR